MLWTRIIVCCFCFLLSSSVQLLSCVRLFAIPWTAARQVSLSITNSRRLLRLMSVELVMPSNHLILCCPLLLSKWDFKKIIVIPFVLSTVRCVSFFHIFTNTYLFGCIGS